MTRATQFTVLLLILSAAPGCSGSRGDEDTESTDTGDTDGDTDSDTDSDTDGDTDGDTDTDVDTDTDSDTDGDTDGDADTDTDGDTDTDVDSDADTDVDGDTDTDMDGDTDTDADTDADADTDSDTDTELPPETIYYVSNSIGRDDNDGLSQENPIASVSRVNELDLGPGTAVLFKCGDVWRDAPLTVTKSGEETRPIVISSYPEGCADRPQLVGAQPISGWSAYSGNIYFADLGAGENAGKFGYGVSRLFKDDSNLTLGRLPNLDAADGGYSTIESASGSDIKDSALPQADWTGASVHIKGMRWYILNRVVKEASGTTLTLNAAPGCYGETCAGWGYFLNNHLSTLDQDGEWYYDAAQNRIYLYSESGAPADGSIEGTVILSTGDDAGRSWGGITLGEDLTGEGISYVRVENLTVKRWYRDGIAIPTNFAHFEPHHLVIRNNTIQDVDHAGIDLATWVYDAQDGRPDGWRGGYNLTVSGNTIERANHMGINLYSRDSNFRNNLVRDVGQIRYLGAAGMGCGIDEGEGACTEDGDGIRVKIDQVEDSGNRNTFTGNRLERIGYSGIQIFGHSNTLERNVILEPCNAKGDCGAISTYSGTSLKSSPVYDLTLRENIIEDTIGNTDGCLEDYDSLFGFGLYLGDSRDTVIEGNTVIGSTVHGILLMNASGSVIGNTLYNNGLDRPYDGSQVYVGSPPSAASALTGNILFGLGPEERTLTVEDLDHLGTSNDNYFFNPYRADNIYADGDMRTLSSWQTISGKDADSVENWFTLNSGDPPNSEIFYNDTHQVKTIDLSADAYLDLDQNPVSESLTLEPYQSKILIRNDG